jgi:hypothetical protein
MTVTQLESFRAVARWRHFGPRPAFCPQDLSPAKRAIWRKYVRFKQTCFRNPYCRPTPFTIPSGAVRPDLGATEHGLATAVEKATLWRYPTIGVLLRGWEPGCITENQGVFSPRKNQCTPYLSARCP